VAARSGIVGSNLAQGMDVCLRPFVWCCLIGTLGNEGFMCAYFQECRATGKRKKELLKNVSHFCFVFGRFRVQISDRRPVILTYFLWSNSVPPGKFRGDTLNQATTASSHVVSSSLFIYDLLCKHSFVQRTHKSSARWCVQTCVHLVLITHLHSQSSSPSCYELSIHFSSRN
jgi:hypothetical protein